MTDLKEIQTDLKQKQASVEEAKLKIAQFNGAISQLKQDLEEKHGISPEQIEEKIQEFEQQSTNLTNEIVNEYRDLQERMNADISEN